MHTEVTIRIVQQLVTYKVSSAQPPPTQPKPFFSQAQPLRFPSKTLESNRTLGALVANGGWGGGPVNDQKCLVNSEKKRCCGFKTLGA